MNGFRKILTETYDDFKAYVLAVSDKYTADTVTIDGIKMTWKTILNEDDSIWVLKEINKYGVKDSKDLKDAICRILKISRDVISELTNGEDILINGEYYHTIELTAKNNKKILFYGYLETRKSFVGGFLIADVEKRGA